MINQRKWTWKQEVIAGLTTFFTMAYIMVVNPLILADAGLPFEQGFTATIIATVAGTLIMGLWANYPIAIAPAMGLNAYFAYSVVKAERPDVHCRLFGCLCRRSGVCPVVFDAASLQADRSDPR